MEKTRDRITEVEARSISDHATLVEEGDRIHNVFQHNERAVILTVPKELFDGREIREGVDAPRLRDQIVAAVCEAMGR